MAAWRMVVRQHGGPEVIEREDFDPPAPGEGDVLLETEAIGLNFIDTYYRTGLYPADLPLTLGFEPAGAAIRRTGQCLRRSLWRCPTASPARTRQR